MFSVENSETEDIIETQSDDIADVDEIDHMLSMAEENAKYILTKRTEVN